MHRLHPGSTYEIRESYDFCGNLRYFPESCKEFGPSLTALEEACKPLVKNLLRTLAIALELKDKEYFVTRSKCLDDHNVDSFTTFRSLYYPPIPDNISPGTVRCADHSDYGILTLLFQDEIGGLEVSNELYSQRQVYQKVEMCGSLIICVLIEFIIGKICWWKVGSSQANSRNNSIEHGGSPGVLVRRKISSNGMQCEALVVHCDRLKKVTTICAYLFPAAPSGSDSGSRNKKENPSAVNCVLCSSG